MKRKLAVLITLALTLAGCAFATYRNGDVKAMFLTCGRTEKGEVVLGDGAGANFKGDVSVYTPEMVAAIIEGAKVAAAKGVTP